MSTFSQQGSYSRKGLNFQLNYMFFLSNRSPLSYIVIFSSLCKTFLELTSRRRCPFHYRGLECKSRKSGNTWNNWQIWPWSMEWSRAKANRVLPRERNGHSKHPFPTKQEKTLHMDITRWSTPKSDWLYSLQPEMEKLYTVSKNKTKSWLWLRSWTPFCQIRLKLKKVGKTTRPFRYDLNQIPYYHIVEVTDSRD